LAGAPRDGRHDRHLVAVDERGVEPAQEAAVLVVHVEGDEAVGVALLVS
jgi:hypothetical protein